MQLHWGWAALGALAIGAGLIWWMQPADDSLAHPDNPDKHGAGHHGSQADAGPTLYRWVDAHGVVNITTEHPPAGRKFSIVHIDPNQNIVPMSDSDSASKAKTTAH